MTINGMVRCALVAAALSATLTTTAYAATNCGSPGANQAIVWQHDNFTGNCDILNIGSYSYSAVSAMSVGNDSISSVSVGSNVKVTLFEHDLPPHYGPMGDWLPMIASRSVVADFNDKTSSIRVEARNSCPAPGTLQVVVYADANFSGNCDLLDLGFAVPYAKLTGLSVGNDTISSIKCGSGTGGTLLEHDLSGLQYQFFAGCSISNLTGTFNDMTSSIVLQQ